MFLKKANIYTVMIITSGISGCSIEAPDACYEKVCEVENGTGTCNRETGECEYDCYEGFIIASRNRCVSWSCLEKCLNILWGIEHGEIGCSDYGCTYTCDEDYFLENDTCISEKPVGMCDVDKCQEGLLWKCEGGIYEKRSTKCLAGICADEVKCAECANVDCTIMNGTGRCVQGACSYTCDRGYMFDDVSSECIDKCENVDCSIPNGMGGCDDGICHYVCDDGYELHGAVCVDKCDYTDCGIEHGTGECDKGICHYTCDEGYELYHDTECVDKCALKFCMWVMNGTSWCEKGECFYKCDDGYELHGAVCVDKCDYTDCGIEHGTGECDKGICHYTCDDGYELQGTKCVDKCIDVFCLMMPNSTNRCEKGKCIYTCYDGYEMNAEGECVSKNGNL